jgi:hypothetical protein
VAPGDTPTRERFLALLQSKAQPKIAGKKRKAGVRS